MLRGENDILTLNEKIVANDMAAYHFIGVPDDFHAEIKERKDVVYGHKITLRMLATKATQLGSKIKRWMMLP